MLILNATNTAVLAAAQGICKMQICENGEEDVNSEWVIG